MGVYIGAVKDDYSAMQGPAPDGFHVPSKDEWVALCGILTTTFSMNANATTMGTYLKMPLAGYRTNTNANVYSLGSVGYYWSSTSYNVNFAYNLEFNTSSISPAFDRRRAYGYSVRCFKDTPTIPTSSWTTLYQGSGSAGVFWSSTDGLISVSGDGQTWYTIMDKNLGATTVYNQGDTLTDANCGYFYQWGNNYGFPHSGSVTTSSTQVNAQNYGPGNYYSSSTFITRSSSPYDWSSIRNDNLWGGVTGVKPTSLKNAYIGEYRVPGVNTLVYLPLNQEKQLTNLGNLSKTFTSVGVNWGTNYVELPSYGTGVYSYQNQPANDYSEWTISIWCNITAMSHQGHYGSVILGINNYGAGDNKNVDAQQNIIAVSGGRQYTLNYANYYNVWHNLVITSDGAYLDGNPLTIAQSGSGSTINTYSILLGKNPRVGSSYGIKGKLSEFIFEKIKRSQQEAIDYHNQTKSNYGL